MGATLPPTPTLPAGASREVAMAIMILFEQWGDGPMTSTHPHFDSDTITFHVCLIVEFS